MKVGAMVEMKAVLKAVYLVVDSAESKVALKAWHLVDLMVDQMVV
jgi:hypothetical protein